MLVLLAAGISVLLTLQLFLIADHAGGDIVLQDNALIQAGLRRQVKPVADLVARHYAADILIVADRGQCLEVVGVQSAGCLLYTSRCV